MTTTTNFFNNHSLNPTEIAQAVKTHGGLAVMAILTTQTCGEACWHAREEVCRCSCGGRNHGCLNHGGAQPERTAKIGGFRYKLAGIGKYSDIIKDAQAINKAAGYRSVEKPMVVIDSTGGNYTPEQIEQARRDGKRVWFQQYKYTWSETEDGSPARMKTVSASQRKWKELSGWQSGACYLLWQRIDMPEQCKEPVVDSDTGLPLADQTAL